MELLFNRALKFSFSLKKIFFIFPSIALCGLVIVLFHGLALKSSGWIGVSVNFLPAFLCTGILMAGGVCLSRLYHNEVKGLPLKYRKTAIESYPLMVKVVSFTLPLTLTYFALWLIMGTFFLLKEIPNVGDFLGVILSFGPFILIFGCLVLILASILFIFFVTPLVALKSETSIEKIGEVFLRLCRSPYSHVLFLLMGLLPLVFLAMLLMLAAAITEVSFFATERTWAIIFQWFFIMIPFSVLVSPGVIFFFNFATEAFVSLQQSDKKI